MTLGYFLILEKKNTNKTVGAVYSQLGIVLVGNRLFYFLKRHKRKVK